MTVSLRRILPLHPRALLHALFTYPRFLGRIKPDLMGGQEAEAKALLRSYRGRWESVRLEPPLCKRMLVVAPHPDDETLGAGGLILAHRGLADVHIVNLFDGRGGGRLEEAPARDDEAYQDALVAERSRELHRVAAALGAASVRQLGLDEAADDPPDGDIGKLRDAVRDIQPDMVLLPWFLDGHRGHRLANLLYARAARGVGAMVFGYEIWSLCEPNAILDITPHLEEKLALIALYETQNATVDYRSLASSLAALRGFQAGLTPNRTGAAEAFFALPSPDYCDLVEALFGEPGRPTGALR